MSREEIVLDYDLLSEYLSKSSSEAVYVDVENIDLDFLSEFYHSVSFGITDPIGQLQAWLYDRLKELASWFSSIVDTIVSPVRATVNAIDNFIRTIPERVNTLVTSAVSSMISGLEGVIRGLISGVSGLITDVQNYLLRLRTFISDSFKTVSQALTDVFNNIVSSLVDAFSKTWSIIRDVAGSLSDALSKIGSGMLDALSYVAKSLGDAITSLGDMLSKVLSKLWDGIQSLFKSLSDSLSSIGKAVLDSLSSVGDMILKGIEKAGDVLSNILNTIWSGIQSLGSAVTDLFGKIWEGIKSFGEWLYNGVKSFIDWLWNGIQEIGRGLSDFFGRIWEGIKSFFQWLWNSLQDVGKWLWDALQNAGKWLYEHIKGFIDWLWGGIQWLGGLLADTFGKIWEGVKGFFHWLWEQITGGLSWIKDVISDAVKDIIKTLGNIVSEGVNNILKSLSVIGQIVYQGLLTIGSGLASLGTVISRGFTVVGEIVVNGLTNLTHTMSEFSKYVTSFGAQVLGGLASIGGAIQSFIDFVKNLPKALESVFKGIVDFFSKAYDFLKDVVSNPLEAFKKYIVEPIWSGLQWLGGKILEGLKTLWDLIQKGASWLWERLVDLYSAITSWFSGVFTKIAEIFSGFTTAFANAGRSVAEAIYTSFMKLFDWVKEASSKALGEFLKPVLKSFWDAVGWGSPPGLTFDNFALSFMTITGLSIPLYLYYMTSTLPLRALGFLLKSAGEKLDRSELKARGFVSVYFTGGQVEFNFLSPLGAWMKSVGEEISEQAKKLYEPFWFGIGFWYSRYVSTLLSYYLRNYIPIEFPSPRESEEAFFRARVTEKIPKALGEKKEDVIMTIMNFLKMRGYSDYMLKWWFADPEEYYFTVVDRFNKERKIPAGSAWVLPSPSEVARMWVRDVLRPTGLEVNKMIENLTKIYEARGMYKDIGLLYTLLAFRYPSPEDLGRFYWRGMAKAFWLEQSFQEDEWKKMFDIGWDALSPVQIQNQPTDKQRADILNEMINLYMRWHDYFPAAWNKNFPTDKAIIVELMTSLPERVDMRWLLRYGIFEHLMASGLNPMASLKEIFETFGKLKGDEVFKEKVEPKISLDVRLVSRFLIARSVNPLFAPMIAVAWAHMLMLPEFTLLRTGFIDALRRGFIDIHTSEALMSGLFIMEVKTGYVKPTDGTFEEVTYKKPVFWLPSQRRLLQLRGVFDRYNILLRDLVTRLVHATIRLALYPDEAVETLKGLHSSLSKHISGLVEALTGRKWAPALDEEYINIWMQYGEKLRKIGAREWIRTYATRLISWISYRLTYGWVSEEDYDKLVKALVENKWITEDEAKFFKVVMSHALGIVKRELIPTPAQLGTFAEYLVISDDVINLVLKEHRVPEAFHSLWRDYIRVKPFKSDYKSLLTVAVRAWRYKVISDDEFNSYLSEALKYGFKDVEIDIIRRKAELEHLIDEAKNWRPSLLTLLSISEYVPEALDLLQYYKVDPRFSDVVMKYAKIRPLADEIRALTNTYFRVKRSVEIPADLEKMVLDVLTRYGLTKEEIALRELRMQLEVLYEEYRAWIPTPSSLATLSEYVTLPENLVSEALTKRRVPKEWMSIWLQYIKVRPLKSDFRALISAYIRALRYNIIDKSAFESLLKEALSYGFTQAEIDIISRRADMELKIEEARAWRPSISTLITIIEYVPEAISLLKKYVIDPDFKPVIERYASVRPLADDIRSLVSAFYRMKRYAIYYRQTVPAEIESSVTKYMDLVGMTNVERSIRDLTAQIEAQIDIWREEFRRGETIPTLGVLATMSEYIDVPKDYIDKILAERKVETTYAELWRRYVSVRIVASEVNRVVNVFERLFERFAVPQGLINKIRDLMASGGWTSRELEIFSIELDLRRNLRILMTLTPSLRQIVTDVQYLAPPDKIIEDILKTYGIEIERYKAQVEYYKNLAKNRRIWRHFAWYRSRLEYAFRYGAIDENTTRTLLKKFVDIGLLTDAEVDMIIEGMKISRQGYIAYRTSRYGGR
jgi:phage-related protein